MEAFNPDKRWKELRAAEQTLQSELFFAVRSRNTGLISKKLDEIKNVNNELKVLREFNKANAKKNNYAPDI